MHHRAHGFIPKRDIVTNASEHVNKRYVLNFDLENFFESISFRRVRQMFISYFGFNDKVATTLANICCHPKGFLPQGAATSPVISNIIANGLDKELTRIAKNSKWSKYTRYADDITFSTDKRKFPQEIAQLIDGHIVLSEIILNVIQKHGFTINHKKTRLQNHKENQTVTGITVNEKLNVNRKYIRRIRSILDCIEKNIEDIGNAEKIFESKYPYRQKRQKEKPEMFRILKGMISHVGNVKGKEDPVYLKLANRFNGVAKSGNIIPFNLPITSRIFHENHTFIIDNEEFEIFITEDGTEDLLLDQGTGFILKNIGLVTNAHVVKPFIDTIESKKGRFVNEFYISFFKAIEHHVKYSAKIIYHNTDMDIAVLEINNMNVFRHGYKYNKRIERGQKIELVGFPTYRLGQEISIKEGVVEGIRVHKSRDGLKDYTRYEISPTIHGGNSGGPVVNDSNEVIAVAVKGLSDNGRSPNEVIPISDVIQLVEESKKAEEKVENAIDQT